MTARQDLLQAAHHLAATGQIEFGPADLVREARNQGSTYPDSTLRTHINGPMCANSPDHHAVKWGDFTRVGHGRYRLTEHADRDPEPTASVRQPETTPAGGPDIPTKHLETEQVDPQDEWHWEGNVQTSVVAHLAADGWQIRRVADTVARQHGHDIEAVRDGQRLLVEVKGYPSDRHVRGHKRGQPKTTSPAVQARHWFAGAVLTAMLARNDAPEARVALALPDFATYRTLANRTRSSLIAAGIHTWLVSEDGVVTATSQDLPS